MIIIQKIVIDAYVSMRSFFYSPKTYGFIDSYKIDHEKVLFFAIELIVSQNYFELASISKSRSSIFRGFTVNHFSRIKQL